MTKYVVTMTWEGKRFTGFCTLEAFEENRSLYLERGDTYEIFDGPDVDGSDGAFDEVKRLALALCAPEEVERITPELKERIAELIKVLD